MMVKFSPEIFCLTLKMRNKSGVVPRACDLSLVASSVRVHKPLVPLYECPGWFTQSKNWGLRARSPPRLLHNFHSWESRGLYFFNAELVLNIRSKFICFKRNLMVLVISFSEIGLSSIHTIPILNSKIGAITQKSMGKVAGKIFHTKKMLLQTNI